MRRKIQKYPFYDDNSNKIIYDNYYDVSDTLEKYKNIQSNHLEPIVKNEKTF